MTLRTRKVLFYGLVALFLVVGTGVVLYAQGWRLDLSTFKAEKVGAIYIRSYPDDAAIFIDGKSIQNKSGFLSPGTFISNLFPKSYTVTLKEQGYDAWSENALVAPSMVVQMKYAVLVPSNATSVAIIASPTVQSFFEAGGNIIATNASSSAILWRGKKIAAGAIISHSTDLKNFIYQDAAGSYILYDLTEATTTNLTPVLKSIGATTKMITSITIDPYDATRVIVQTPQNISAIDLSNSDDIIDIANATRGQRLQPPLAISQSLFAWTQFNIASDTSQVVIYDKFAGNITDNSLVITGAIKELKWIDGGTLGIVEANGELYRYNVGAEQLAKIADDVRDFYPTNDGTELATLEDNSVEIFSFTTTDYYRFNLPNVAAAQSLAWYKDDTHLFVSYPDHVSLLDLADLSLRNFITVSAVSQGSAPFYDVSQNALYVVDQGQKLIRFDFPS
jgi:hypothetical protein